MTGWWARWWARVPWAARAAAVVGAVAALLGASTSTAAWVFAVQPAAKLGSALLLVAMAAVPVVIHFTPPAPRRYRRGGPV